MGSQPNPQRPKPGKIDSSAFENAEKKFLESGGKFEKFRIGDLFEIGTGSLISSDNLIDGDIFRISAKSDNNGILGKYKTEELLNARHFENFISVNFFGDTFYHPYKASVEMKVHTLKLPNHKFTPATGLYFAGIIKKYFSGRYGYGNQLSSSMLKSQDFRITLPVEKSGKIAFNYMEERIKELEHERIKELEAYLQATGLRDHQLSAEENRVLADFNDLIENPHTHTHTHTHTD